MGLGGQFNFSIYEIFDPLAEGSNDSFSLNATTGLLRGLRIFNREDQPEGIVVAIETSDFGEPPQSTITNITVMIGDKNDQLPYFPSNRSIVAYELLPPGEKILDEFRAIDEDIGINAELTYEIFDGDPRNQFSIDPLTGGLSTADTLNKTNQTFYYLTIIARDGGTPQYHAFGHIEIQVIDSNDNVPTFTMDTYVANLTEGSPIGTVVVQVNASDMDIGTNAEIEYFLAGTSNYSMAVNERFFVNATTGELVTNDEFDREQDESFVLSVVAIDNGTVPTTLTGSATVHVIVRDVNDHTPYLHNESYSGDVVENSPNDTFVLSVSASDGDAERPNNDITFSLNGSRSDVFQIEPTSGDITVAMEVDWEEGEVINITVIVTDRGQPPLSSTANVTIYIEDINDRAPFFPPGSLSLGIFENTDPPAPVTPSVMAMDPDSRGNSSRVSYQVLADLTDGRFVLDSESGEVTFVRGTLNRERRLMYNMLIRAMDHGTPQLHTDATLNIAVLDVNDFDPVFNEEHFYGTVSENATVGTTILTLGATDRDVGTNAELSYYLIASDEDGYFTVNETSGDLLTASEELDFELRTLYSLVFMVMDHGTPSRNDTSLGTVTITDFNDNRPMFTGTPYSEEMIENLSPYTTVLRVSSMDEDSGFNNATNYTLAPGEGTEYFDIDPNSGVLYTVRYIDREVTPAFKLTVVANNSLSPHPLWSTVQALVTILDLSDTHPSFDLVTHVSVREDAQVGPVVFNLSATDGDEGLAGTVHYHIIHGNDEGIFDLDSTTGTVSLTVELDFESVSLYEFVVSATDMTNLTNYTNVLVRVLDVNDNPPRFASLNYTLTLHNLIDVGSVVLGMVAEDADSGTNAELVYEMEGGAGFFDLQSSTEPSLMVSGSLEHQSGEAFSLVVTVRNPAGTQLQFGRANVTVQVTSTLPLFFELCLSDTVAEDESPPTTVTELSLFSSAVSYSIEGGNTEEVFRVDDFGTLSLNPGAGVVLDYETTPTYQLTVSAEDSAGNKHFNVLTITLSDVNDISPEFISSSFLVHIPETTPVGVAFYTVMATDSDGSYPANDVEIGFSGTVSEAVTSTFDIDPSTGDIYLLRELDYGNVEDRNFTFEISASNERVFPVLSAVTTVSIVVVDGNKHSPVFTSQILEPVVLYENETVGLSIFNATAEDEDEGSAGEITFGLRGNHRYLDFSIDTFTGEVVLSSELDREITIRYQLVIVAGDRGNPGLTSTTLLVVGVQDVNDNTPEWMQLEYSAVIHENTSIDSVIAVVMAEDPDQVDSSEDEDGETVYHQTNGLVQYSITEGDPWGQFFVEPLTGAVKIAAPLDRELMSDYLLTLTATDGGGRSANATLSITLLDVNDVEPIFSQDEYAVAIPEDSENGTFVVDVSADDPDLGEGAFFFYDIDTGNTDDAFAINSSTGVIWLDLPVLDRESIAVYNLTVAAIDFGKPSLTGTTQVIVHLLDLNEFPPVFDEVAYTGMVAENASFFYTILSPSTTDLDYGENATATYSIISNDTLPFDIEPSSGEIFLSAHLDFEEVSEYQFIVVATDNGPISTRLSNQVNVTVVVTDINDNPPMFLNSSYTISVREDTLPHSPLAVLLASDEDSGVNADISFSLEGSLSFIIHPLTGTLSLSNDTILDYEAVKNYSFFVTGTDSGDPQLNSTVPIVILVEDVNDNAPAFVSNTTYRASVMENLPPGQVVTGIEAGDADSEENGLVEYSIEGRVESESDCIGTCPGISEDVCLTITLLSNNITQPPPPFTVDSGTGVVSTALPLDREEQSSYLLTVRATDSGNETRLSSFTCLLVTVLDDNDETPSFPSDSYNTTISEATSEGVLVVRVTALDDDSGLNALVTYHIVGSETAHFTVHPSTGEILTLGGYDRERRDKYDVIVLATDSGDPPLNSSTVVTVTISDENDNAPLFNQSEYSIVFPENEPPFSSVYLFQAVDEDIGPNSELSYAMLSPYDHFTINASSGLLQSTIPFDREEIASYLVTIISTDMGNPPLSSSALVNITVQDTNDNAPVFTRDEYFTSVDENVLLESPLVYVAATDADTGTNSFVRYSLNGTSPHVEAFAVNSTSGSVCLLSPLDAELSLSYTLTVTAANEDAVPELSTLVNVSVAVGDVNDHAPMFSQGDYVVGVSEAAEVGSKVIQLQATDGDATVSQQRAAL